MAIKINGVDYPDSSADILADRNLGTLFRAYVKKRVAFEWIDFIDAASKPSPDVKMLYRTFISRKAKQELNLSDGLRREAEALTQKKKRLQTDWKNAGWKPLLKKIVAVAYGYLDSNFADKTNFYKFEGFQKYHRTRVFNEIKVNPKLAKKLHISDANGLKSVFFLLKMGEQAKAERLIDNLVAAEALKGKGPEIVKGLMKMNGLR